MSDQPQNPTVPGPEGAGPLPGGPHAAPGAVAPRNGTIAWALGFLAYLPIPFLGLIVAGLAQLFVGLGQRKHGGLAAVNGVRAANWGLTQLCWPPLMALTILLGVLTGTPGEGGVQFPAPVMVLVFVMLGLFVLLCVLEAVYAIIGTIQASKGRQVRLPAIPFFRAPRG